MYVQTYFMVEWIAVSFHREAGNECNLKFTSLILAGLKDPSDSCDWTYTVKIVLLELK